MAAHRCRLSIEDLILNAIPNHELALVAMELLGDDSPPILRFHHSSFEELSGAPFLSTKTGSRVRELHVTVGFFGNPEGGKLRLYPLFLL